MGLGMWGPNQEDGRGSLGFSFCLIYSRLGAEKTGNLETPLAQTTKAQQKSVISGQSLGREQPHKIENFWIITALLKPNTTEKTVPFSTCHPCQHRVKGEPRLQPSSGCSEEFSPCTGVVSRTPAGLCSACGGHVGKLYFLPP